MSRIFRRDDIDDNQTCMVQPAGVWRLSELGHDLFVGIHTKRHCGALETSSTRQFIVTASSESSLSPPPHPFYFHLTASSRCQHPLQAFSTAIRTSTAARLRYVRSTAR